MLRKQRKQVKEDKKIFMYGVMSVSVVDTTIMMVMIIGLFALCTKLLFIRLDVFNSGANML